VYVPRIFRRLCSSRVLTMEFVHGVLMSDFVAVRDADPAAALQWLAENEIVPKRVGRLLHLSLLRQILEDNLFHGDLHPGNIMLLRRSRVALIDFGSVGSLESRFRRLYLLLNRAMAESEYEKVADILALIAPRPDPSIDWDRIRRLVATTLRQAEIRAWAPNLSYHERSMNTAMVEVARSLAGSKIPVGWTFMRVDRAHVTLDASLMYLIPDVNYVSLGKRYFREARSRAFSGGVVGQLADRIRRARTTSIGRFLAERLQLGNEELRSGATIFRDTRRHAEVIAQELAGFGGRLLLAAAVVTLLFFGVRDLGGRTGQAAVQALMPALAASTANLGLLTGLLASAGFLWAALGLLVFERRLARWRHDEPEVKEEVK
jgi:ubiquinone biosynthesis protein